MRNLRTARVVYWVNVSESSGAGLPGSCFGSVVSVVVVHKLQSIPWSWVCFASKKDLAVSSKSY